MCNTSLKKNLTNERGTAMIETLPILVIFVVLLSYSIGLFGVVHTGIMNSMASRTYAFETFSNRADTTLFRDRRSNNKLLTYEKWGNRFHATNSELEAELHLPETQYATTRDLAFGRRIPASESKPSDHNSKIYEIAGRNREGGVEASPAWIMVGYGLCITAKCGGN